MKTQKTWFITGASRGFGLEITKAVLAAGDKVVATVRSKAAEFQAGFNGNPDLLVVTMDVANEQQVSAAVSAKRGRVVGVDTSPVVCHLPTNTFSFSCSVPEITYSFEKCDYFLPSYCQNFIALT